MKRAGRCGLVAASLVLAAGLSLARSDIAWRGTGWYQVAASPAGWHLLAGPYPSELACKKAMNSSSGKQLCKELPEAPAAR